MLDTLITSKTRLKLLLKLFLNPSTSGYLQGLASEFGESSNAIRVELNRFEDAGLLSSEFQGRKRFYKANRNHSMFIDIQNILKKYVGIDAIVENIVARTGNLQEVYIEGDLAQGKVSSIIDLVLVGEELDRIYIASLISKAEKMLNKRIRYVCLSSSEISEYFKSQSSNSKLLIWSDENRKKQRQTNPE
ncbi:ArsR family transcriptional regulator [Phaeocystidibacter luteus]|uniref:ArsR family transcriptional regulator n=1 Tax=Phaeocystidibacter luteus TaxID=911197 RepID=A0A6N6RIZ2_9FLAO|nr:ArsR family transcriptional regulator [Phaeocystidibacter luteus]KAB2814313.1 ArsR family transcriptional regulator [Phaeocystidibacter luteus]